jgi:predicted nucleotidyltransferase
MKLNKKQKRSLKKVFEKEDVGFAYLFGSQATGQTNNGDV